MGNRRSLFRTTVALCVLLGCTGLTSGEAWAQGPAGRALNASLVVERTLLEEDRDRFDEISRRRSAAETRLGQLHEALDAAVQRDDAGAVPEIDRLLGLLEPTKGQATELQIAERVILGRIRDRMRRIALLEEQLVGMQGQARAKVGELDGTWDVVLLPHEQRGAFVITQSGAVINGTYRLSGGFSGSLQGTLVQNKVLLQRIDSQLGRSMELEGRLSSDKTRIRGTWTSFELAGTEAAIGQWSATRRPTDEEPEPE